jgi:transposase InsO family protein
MSMEIGSRVLACRRGEAAAAARVAGVSPRTLARWKRRARCGETAPRCGRPPHCEQARRRAEELVKRHRETQGVGAGWRTIKDSMEREGDVVPTRLIQEALSKQKSAGRRQERRRCAAHRISHDVVARDAVWAQDSTKLGDRVIAEVAKDRASTAIRGLSLGAPATAQEVIALLEAMRRRSGGLPLVWQTDNGPAYTSEEVRKYLILHRVVHLRSRVRTPTDNPAIERGIGELKEELGGREPTPANVARACTLLDHGRLRASRGRRTAHEVDGALPRACDLVDRERFYEEACSAIQNALHGLATERVRRKAERAAIWGVLERHGLARARGPATPSASPGPGAREPEIG